MIVTEYNIENPTGLNGFFGDLWNGFKTAFGATDNDPDNKGFGKRLGKLLGSLAKKAVVIAVLKTKQEYVPTPNERAILKPIIDKLNKYVIDLTNELEDGLNSNLSASEKLKIVNSVFRKYQIVYDYYSLRADTRLSQQCYDYFLEQLYLMVETFEITIEEMLSESEISYNKKEVVLLKNTADTYPFEVIGKTNFSSTGIQYEPIGKLGDTEIKVPTKENVKLETPKPINSTTVFSGNSSSNAKEETKSSYLLPLLMFSGALLLLFTGKKEKK